MLHAVHCPSLVTETVWHVCSLTATADVRLLALGRDDFTRLLGPLQSLLESQAVAYDTPTSKISKVSELHV